MASPEKPINIIDHLYLGNFDSAEYSNLESESITAVVCLTQDCQSYPENITLLHIDDISENLDPYTFDIEKLDHAVDFIRSHILQGHNVLVHCKAGASRSPTVIIAYLIKTKGLSVVDACRYVKFKANYINPTFMDLLDEYYLNLVRD